jgi:hypothetical protein
MKFSTLLLLVLLSGFSTIQYEGQWVIDANSQLLIHGRTNVNSFTCTINCYNQIDTLAYRYSYDERGKSMMFSKNKMELPVYNFDCGNPMITKDFRITTKATQHPYLQIAFLSLDNVNKVNPTAKMEISLAGTTREVTVIFNTQFVGDLIQLKGSHPVCFADFGMQAPARMMGLVKVQEDLTVEFNLLVNPI